MAKEQTGAHLKQLVDGIDFGEGPRWREDSLWYSDFYQQRVCRVNLDGHRETVIELDDQPSGLGWLPNGELLIVAMKSKSVLRYDGESLHVHADLSALATGLCNDMVVAEDGTAYVGHFGFDLQGGESFRPASLLVVHPDGRAEVAAQDLAFPNGSVITPDGRTLIVGQSFSGAYAAFDIDDAGALSGRRVWATIPGSAPDGCALDEEGAIWFSDANGSRVVRVREGGDVTHEIATPQPTFACALGGPDGRTLFVLTAPGAHPKQASGTGRGALWTATVEICGAGRP